MSNTKRKIGFYSLRLVHIGNGKKSHNVSELKNVINYIGSLDKKDRKDDNVSTHKVLFLDQIITQDDIQKLIFKSAKYNHIPPLIDKVTATERKSNKKLTEGESEKTHIGLKYLTNEVVVIIEERRAGVSIGKFINYLLKFAITYYIKQKKELDFNVIYSPIPKENFLEELNKLNRVQYGEIYIEKKILGSDFLNYSNRLENVKEDLIITLKAVRKRSIKDTARDLFNKHAANGSDIKKMRLYGINQDGDDSILDTEVIKRIQYVIIDLNEQTGLVDSNSIFDNFTLVLDEYTV